MSLLLRSLIVVFLLLSFNQTTLLAQGRTCETTVLHEIQMQNPKYAKSFREKLAKINASPQSEERVLCPVPVRIPIAVHFQNFSNPDAACLETLAQDQLNIINNDFQGTNVDISNWINNDASNYPGVNYGETCVEFCIASQNHPSGYGLVNGDLAITINQVTGDFSSDWSGYLNVFVRNISALGYSPLGGNGNGDGVTIDNNAFGSGAGCNGANPASPYDLGRTLSHELGHYLLLDHIWGGGCGNDDGVTDTPDSQSSYFGCPSGYPSTCGSTDMHMNYMDYTNDACMYMFSGGQATVMEGYISSSLSILSSNAVNVCGTGAPPTCTDGIMNGDETGVDCGGATCPACPPPTCTDGIMNGNETGVDCGGPTCPACPIVYCSSQGNNTSDEWIGSVAIGSFSNVSGDNNGYGDFTAMTITIEQDVSTSFTLTPEWAGQTYNEYFRIWVDLNVDGDFTDSGEMLFDQGSANSNVQTGNITIPSSSTIGQTRMRISMKYNTSPGPCESFTWGEVEDYTVDIIAPQAPPNDLCSGAISVGVGNYPGTLLNSTTTNDPTGSCGGVSIDGPGVWYTFTSSGNEFFNLDVCGATIDTKMHIYEGSCGNLICNGLSDDNSCDDDAEISFTSPSNAVETTYFVFISGAAGTTGDFILNVAASPLPVELVKFTGHDQRRGNLMSWLTATEVNLKHFDLERSVDLSNWEKIAEIQALGNENASSEYSFMDDDPPRLSYYRLTSNDYDGTKSYSESVQIDRELTGLNWQLFPNPADEIIRMKILSPVNGTATYVVNDVSGKSITDASITFQKGENIIPLNILLWPSGIYFIRLEIDGVVSNNRFVKR